MGATPAGGPLAYVAINQSLPTVTVGGFQFSAAGDKNGVVQQAFGVEPNVFWTGSEFVCFVRGPRDLSEDTYDGNARGFADNASSGTWWYREVVKRWTSPDGDTWTDRGVVLDRDSGASLGSDGRWVLVVTAGDDGYLHMTSWKSHGYTHGTTNPGSHVEYHRSTDPYGSSWESWGAGWTLVNPYPVGAGSGVTQGDGTIRYTHEDDVWASSHYELEDGTYIAGNNQFHGPNLGTLSKNSVTGYPGMTQAGILNLKSTNSASAGQPCKLYGGTQVWGHGYWFDTPTLGNTNPPYTPTSNGFYRWTNYPNDYEHFWSARIYNPLGQDGGNGGPPQQLGDGGWMEVNGVTHFFWELLARQGDTPDLCHATYPGTKEQFIAFARASPLSYSQPYPTTGNGGVSNGKLVLTLSSVGATVTPVKFDGVVGTQVADPGGGTLAPGTYSINGTTLKLATAGVSSIQLQANTSGITITPNASWSQSGTTLTVTATRQNRTTCPATIYSAAGGPVLISGTDAARFAISTDSGATWQSTITVSPGSTSVLLSCLPQTADSSSLTASIGVPT